MTLAEQTRGKICEGKIGGKDSIHNMGTDQTTVTSDLTSEKDYTSKTVLVRVTDRRDKVPNGLSRHQISGKTVTQEVLAIEGLDTYALLGCDCPLLKDAVKDFFSRIRSGENGKWCAQQLQEGNTNSAPLHDRILPIC